MDRNLKKARRKHPDRLKDTRKHLSVNRMAAGLRLQAKSWIFLLSPTFQTYFV